MADTENKVESIEHSKPIVMNLRESFMGLALFIILFGGVAIGSGFVMGIYAATKFVVMYNDQQPTTKALMFCEEMISAYKGRDSLQVQENEELKEVLNQYTDFLADKATTLTLKKQAMGGEGPVGKK